MDGTLHLYSAAQELRTGGPETVRAALLRARRRTVVLSQAYEDALGPAQRVPQRATLNPPLWELGHVAWFQEWWIGRNAQRSRGLSAGRERSESVLAGADGLYDSSNVPHATRWGLPLPDLAGTRDYLARTFDQTLALLEGVPEDASDAQLYFFKLVALHEEMHAEAAIYMARALAVEVPQEVLRQSVWKGGAGQKLHIPAQTFRLGWQGSGFAFDNELQAHDVPLQAFEIDAEPVTWARFMPFVEADGYRDARWWDDDGAKWLRQQPPGLREPRGGGDAPAVHLTAHEARAWCRWAGRRLPTEAEWECAALAAPGFEWGNVWEWTATPFAPYPGFVPHPYRDYSAPWFGTRVVLRGACGATSPSLAHPRYRNFFEPHRDDIFGGFRSCASLPGAAAV